MVAHTVFDPYLCSALSFAVVPHSVTSTSSAFYLPSPSPCLVLYACCNSKILPTSGVRPPVVHCSGFVAVCVQHRRLLFLPLFCHSDCYCNVVRPCNICGSHSVFLCLSVSGMLSLRPMAVYIHCHCSPPAPYARMLCIDFFAPVVVLLAARKFLPQFFGVFVASLAVETTLDSVCRGGMHASLAGCTQSSSSVSAGACPISDLCSLAPWFHEFGLASVTSSELLVSSLPSPTCSPLSAFGLDKTHWSDVMLDESLHFAAHSTSTFNPSHSTSTLLRGLTHWHRPCDAPQIPDDVSMHVCYVCPESVCWRKPECFATLKTFLFSCLLCFTWTLKPYVPWHAVGCRLKQCVTLLPHQFACMPPQSLFSLTQIFLGLLGCRVFVRRVEDYWEGYKLFCYAYYSHSFEHESEFQHSKLGSLFNPSLDFFIFFHVVFPNVDAL